ncbi:MAG: T9SS type A sorting domain-containing protein [Bacteroidales bacterium]
MKTTVQFMVYAVLLSTFSMAQTTLSKYPMNPLLGPGAAGSWSDEGFPFSYLMWVDDTLHLWFTASDASQETRIGHAISNDGITFTCDPAPVFTAPATPSGTFDEDGVFGASVLFDGTSWRMWYNGYNTIPYWMGELKTGLATSTDGIHWTRYSDDPILPLGPPGSWDDKWAYSNTVLFEDGIYKMWYTGNDGMSCSIGYATSTDGINWQKDANNPIMQGLFNGDWDEKNVQNPRVLHQNGIYQMWYNGGNSVSNDYQIGYATSTDGITWERSILNPVLQTGQDWEYDSDWCWMPMVIYSQGVYSMWYTGYDGTSYSLALATDSTNTGFGSLPDNHSPLVNIFPNPANQGFCVNLELQQAGDVSVNLYDIQGREIAVLCDGLQMAGVKQFEVQADQLHPGIYLCYIYIDNQIFKNKIIIYQ